MKSNKSASYSMTRNLLLSQIFILCFAFSSCSKEEVKANDEPLVKIAGAWESDDVNSNSEKLFIFYDDNTWSHSEVIKNSLGKIIDWNVYEGKWIQQKESLSIIYDADTLSYSYEVNGNEFTLTGGPAEGIYYQTNLVNAIRKLDNLSSERMIMGAWEEEGLTDDERNFHIYLTDHTWFAGHLTYNGNKEIIEWSITNGTWSVKGNTLSLVSNNKESHDYNVNVNEVKLILNNGQSHSFYHADLNKTTMLLMKLAPERMINGSWETLNLTGTSCGGFINIENGLFSASSKTTGELIDVSVYSGDTMIVIPNPNSDTTAIAFLTDNVLDDGFSPSYCGEIGYTKIDSATEFVIPASCTYLYVPLTTNGLDCSPKIYVRHTPVSQATSIIKLRIGSWNVGHFALGTSYDTKITHENYEKMQQEWQNAINSISADILCCCEYNELFVNKDDDHQSISARNAIFSAYHFAYIGSKPYKTSYMRTAIFSHFPIENIKQQVYKHTVQAGRYFQYGDLIIDDKTIKIVSTHLDFNQGANGATYREEQIHELVDFFANEPYVIICADWNASISNYDILKENGYILANHGSMGDIKTYPSGNSPKWPLDNIVCKGFDISSINVLNNASLSDHMAIYADFTLIE